MTVGVLDYGLGNIGSLINMFRRVAVDVRLVSTASEVERQTHLILPGVGAFDHGMYELRSRDLVAPIRAFGQGGGSILGICLGMQLLLESSEEGVGSGLGMIPGHCVRLGGQYAETLRVPHMGWNTVQLVRPTPEFSGLESANRFYFAHSFRANCDPADVVGTTVYGDSFPSIIRRGSVLGAQFHPEKSHVFGMNLLTNWSEAS